MKTITARERTNHTREVLKVIEEGGMALLEKIHAAEQQGPTDADVYMVAKLGIANAMNLGWAIRSFPLFDIGCLTRLREFTFEKARLAGGNGTFSGKLFLPHFAWTNWGAGATELYQTAGDLGIFRFGNKYLAFDGSMQQKNRERIDVQTRDSQGYGRAVSLHAAAPSVPKDVKRRVSEIVQRFENCFLIWEAEWEPAPVGDPLVVAEICGNHFLIDQYDVTKLERYIVSEFTTKPKE